MTGYPKSRAGNRINRQHWRESGVGREKAVRHLAYDQWRERLSSFADEILPRLKPGMKIVELGCAAGYWCERLRLIERGCSYTGIDINRETLAMGAERYPQANFVEADLAEYAGLGAFDYVIANQALQFLDTGTVERLLAQIRPGAFVTLFEVAKPDVMAQTRAKTKHRSTNVLHFHPYPAIAADLGLHVLTCSFVEQCRETSPKLKLLLTAQPSSSRA